jgi:hypothetical protein
MPGSRPSALLRRLPGGSVDDGMMISLKRVGDVPLTRRIRDPF